MKQDTAEKYNIKSQANITRRQSRRTSAAANQTGEQKPPPPESDAKEPEAREYKACGVDADNKYPKRLQIRLRGDKGFSQAYSLIPRIHYEHHKEDWFITIECTDCRINLEGKHLKQTWETIDRDTAKYIQEFDGKQFKIKLDELPKGTPVITKITVLFKNQEPDDL